MKVFYSMNDHKKKIELTTGSLLMVIPPEEPNLQEFLVNSLLVHSEGEETHALNQVMQYVQTSHGECDS